MYITTLCPYGSNWASTATPPLEGVEGILSHHCPCEGLVALLFPDEGFLEHPCRCETPFKPCCSIRPGQEVLQLLLVVSFYWSRTAQTLCFIMLIPSSPTQCTKKDTSMLMKWHFTVWSFRHQHTPLSTEGRLKGAAIGPDVVEVDQSLLLGDTSHQPIHRLVKCNWIVGALHRTLNWRRKQFRVAPGSSHYGGPENREDTLTKSSTAACSPHIISACPPS